MKKPASLANGSIVIEPVPLTSSPRYQATLYASAEVAVIGEEAASHLAALQNLLGRVAAIKREATRKRWRAIEPHVAQPARPERRRWWQYL